MKEDCSILILSRDASIRQAYLTSIFLEKYWKDCPYDIYLCTQTKGPEDNKYTKIIYTDTEMCWGERLQKALDEIDTEYIVVCPEDDFLQSNVDTERFQKCIDYARKNNVGAVRLCPPLLFTVSYNDEYDLVPKESVYRLVLHPMLFRKEYLQKFSDKKYTPWQFEREGSILSRKYEELILCVREPLYDSVHAWSSGMWTREGYHLLSKSGIEKDLYAFAGIYPWYKALKDKLVIMAIKIAPNLVTNMRIKQCSVDEKKLRM